MDRGESKLKPNREPTTGVHDARKLKSPRMGVIIIKSDRVPTEPPQQVSSHLEEFQRHYPDLFPRLEAMLDPNAEGWRPKISFSIPQQGLEAFSERVFVIRPFSNVLEAYVKLVPLSEKQFLDLLFAGGGRWSGWKTSRELLP